MCQMMFQMLSQLYKNWFRNSLEDSENSALKMENKIALMEEKITHLEEENIELMQQLEYNRNKEAALQKVLCNYDNLLKKALTAKISNTQDQATHHIANLETAFLDLLQKYEKAKVVVQGFQQNEEVLKKQVEKYEDILDSLRGKFATYKIISENQIQKKNEVTKTNTNGKKRKHLPPI